MTNRRFESISGILNRTATDPSPEAESHSQPDTFPDPTSEAASVTNLHATKPSARRPAPPAAQPRPKASAMSDGGVRRVAFRLDPTLHNSLTAKAASGKTSQGQVVLDAIEAAHRTGTLADLVAAEAAAPQPDGLFPRLKGRGTAQATVPVEIRLHTRAGTVLDQLVTETGADSRTQLIVASLRHHLN